MAVLEQVMQMKQQGIPDDYIIQSLKDQGIEPKEINEALSQSTVKSAIGEQQGTTIETEFQKRPIQTQQPTELPRETMPVTEQTQTPENMQPSMMPSESQQAPEIQPREYPQEQFAYPQYSQPQQYQEEYYQPSDIETINEIAEQIMEEKIQELKKQISSLTKLKQEISPEIQNLKKRLEKVENTINELQMAVLKKIGEYGENIKNISNEMKATQESFSKMINPVLDNQRKSEEPTEDEKSETEKEQKPRRKKKNSPGFEHYLR